MFSQLNHFEYSRLLKSPIWSIDGILTGTTPLVKSEPESNDNDEGVLPIPQSSWIVARPSDGLMLYLGQVGGSYPSAEIQLAYSTVPVDWIFVSLEFFCSWSQWIQIIFNKSIRPIYGILMGTTPLVHSRPESNGNNEGVPHIPQSSWIGVAPSDGLVSYLFNFIREISFSYEHKPIDSSPCFTDGYVEFPFSWWDIATKVYELIY